jgi:hypothetical protein
MLLAFYEMHVFALGLQTPHHISRPIWRFIVNYQDMHVMPHLNELILQRPDYCCYVFALIECRKYDYRFQRDISFFVRIIHNSELASVPTLKFVTAALRHGATLTVLAGVVAVSLVLLLWSL